MLPAVAKKHRCLEWVPIDPTRGTGPDDPPDPEDLVCAECGRPMVAPRERTPCPGCGEMTLFDIVLAHHCGYTAPEGKPN
jgi:hypothetical protein